VTEPLQSNGSERAYAALEQARRRLDQGDELSDAADGRVLEDRARALAQRGDDVDIAGERLDLLVFCCGSDRYGVDLRDVAEVLPPSNPAAVPFTPPAVLGVTSYRGRIIAVIDIPRLSSSAPRERAEPGLIVVLACEAALGIRADSLIGIERVDVQAVRQPAEDESGVIGSVTDGMVAIVDVEALANDGRIRVEDGLE
jgi:purine-binding chemotaxis protein CheW